MQLGPVTLLCPITLISNHILTKTQSILELIAEESTDYWLTILSKQPSNATLNAFKHQVVSKPNMEQQDIGSTDAIYILK